MYEHTKKGRNINFSYKNSPRTCATVSKKKTGVPVTWLDYKDWKLGPVSPKIYDLKDLNIDFPKYIDIVKEPEGKGTRIEPIVEFNNEDFSEFEIGLINSIIDKYEFSPGSDLVEITHAEGGLWNKVVKEHDIHFDEIGVSSYPVVLSELVKSDKQKLIEYQLVKETLEFEASLSGC